MSETTSKPRAHPKDASGPLYIEDSERSQRLRLLKEQLDRDDYRVELGLLASLLVDSQRTLASRVSTNDFY